MKQVYRSLRPAAAVAAMFSLALAGLAQKPEPRLKGPIQGGTRVMLAGSRSPHAAAANDMGALASDTPIKGITLVFNRSAAQQAALDALIAAQQTPGSPQYHQWLTPDQFAAQFGVADSDVTAVESWLQSQGFTVDGMARSHDRITFSGTAGLVATAFGTELHHYRSASGAVHFAPSTDLSVPAAMSSMVSTVLHLSDYRPKPMARPLPAAVRPDYTSSQTQNHYLSPGDVATQYDIKAVYSQGFDGTGQSIAVAGQSYINTQDVLNFQSAAGVPQRAPTMVLIPNSGGAAVYGGDEGESDIDVEYASSIAKGLSNLYFVYAGDSPNYGVEDGLMYAITEGIAPVISYSYGDCELDYTAGEIAAFTSALQQAAAQGQTIVAASGDEGSTNCVFDTNLSVTQQEALSVDVPANLPNVTGIGGLQMQAGTFTSGVTTYFGAASGSDNISSLLSYVPEVVWNEDSATGGINAGGGGTSIFVARPSWQAGVPGIPAGNFRLVPDISLQGSISSPGYLYCTSDQSYWQTGQTASCNSGFRDSSSSLLTVAGGTSFGAPIMAGMIAILNQAKHGAGQGNINPTLYGIASNSTSYAAAFHDIQTGTNACTAGPTYCSTAGASGYSAGVGYDEASGLGSIDFAQLLNVWPAVTGTTNVAGTTTVLTAAAASPASGASDVITITVSSSSGTPTGSVAVTADGKSAGTLALTNGVASYTYPGTTVGGSHVISAVYSGDTLHAASSGSISLTLAGTGTPSGTFALSATAATVPATGTATSTISVTPSSGYNGTVVFTLTGLPSSLCYSLPSIGLPSSTPQQGTATIGSGTTVCSGTAVVGGAGSQAKKQAANQPDGKLPFRGKPTIPALAGLLVIGFAVHRRRLPVAVLAALLTVLSVGLVGCGGSGSSVIPTPTPTQPQTYTVTLTGTDSVTPTIMASTTFSVTVQ